jgi:hypothetical protein
MKYVLRSETDPDALSRAVEVVPRHRAAWAWNEVLLPESEV